jgi:hypothetical protein
MNSREVKITFYVVSLVREEGRGFVAFVNPSATCYTCCGEEEMPCRLVGCKCRCQGGLASC